MELKSVGIIVLAEGELKTLMEELRKKCQELRRESPSCYGYFLDISGGDIFGTWLPEEKFQKLVRRKVGEAVREAKKQQAGVETV